LCCHNEYETTAWYHACCADCLETWLLRLNFKKCKAISYSRRPELNTNYSISGVTVENMTDLGVTFDNRLKFDKHINNKKNNTA